MLYVPFEDIKFVISFPSLTKAFQIQDCVFCYLWQDQVGCVHLLGIKMSTDSCITLICIVVFTHCRKQYFIIILQVKLNVLLEVGLKCSMKIYAGILSEYLYLVRLHISMLRTITSISLCNKEQKELLPPPHYICLPRSRRCTVPEVTSLFFCWLSSHPQDPCN